jgi:hypothetical protein
MSGASENLSGHAEKLSGVGEKKWVEPVKIWVESVKKMSGPAQKLSGPIQKLSDLHWKKRERIGIENSVKKRRNEWKVDFDKNDRKSEKYKEIENFLRDIF